MAEPLLFPSVNEIATLVPEGVEDKDVGGSGTVKGVTVTGGEGELVPTAFMALNVTV